MKGMNKAVTKVNNGRKPRLAFGGTKLNETDLAHEIAEDLNLPESLVLAVVNQLIRRIIYHLIRDHQVSLNFFGRFRMRKGTRHWVIQFSRMRSLDTYVNARLDNDDNQQVITKINPLISHSWYEHQLIKRGSSKLKQVDVSDHPKKEE